MNNKAEAQAHGSPARTGILLVNLGTPEAPTRGAVRRYLAEFLADPRVVEIPRLVWLALLYGVILPLRPKRVAHAYAAIWQNEGSPLLLYTQQLAKALRLRLQASFGDTVQLECAMRYGRPAIAEVMARLADANVQRLLVLPLYPQYSGSTTASVMDAVFSVLMRTRRMPELRSIHQYHDDPGYIAALADSVRRHWQRQGRGERLLLSFHGIPLRYVEAGDPYFCHCQKTARLLREALQLDEDQCRVSFQSRFGKAPWLQPYTDASLKAWGREGIGTVDVLCPGFAADCLETLEEVAIRYREDFLAAGGRELRYIPALNDDPAHIDALHDLAARSLQSWLPKPESQAELAQRRARAERLRPTLHG